MTVKAVKKVQPLLGELNNMIYDGKNGGTVELLDNALVIRRKGVSGFLTQGLKGEKRIPFSSITTVQFKEPGLTTGYIQFGVLGGNENRGGVFDATSDENTVLFLAKALKEFQQLRDAVESRIGNSEKPVSQLNQSIVNFSEELTRIADLRDRGVLTEEEFQEEKAFLQSQRRTGNQAKGNQPYNNTATPVAAPTDQTDQTDNRSQSSVSKKLGKGCLIAIGILFGLIILSVIVSPDEEEENSNQVEQNTFNAEKSDSQSQTVPSGDKADPVQETSEKLLLTASQRNAVRSARQYLDMTGFSRSGLIDQLSSSAGDGYSVADATAAVDSLSVNWNENAEKSARQYLSMQGFSCNGLVDQLSSSAGDKYTVDQAKHGARQAGAC